MPWVVLPAAQADDSVDTFHLLSRSASMQPDACAFMWDSVLHADVPGTYATGRCLCKFLYSHLPKHSYGLSEVVLSLRLYTRLTDSSSCEDISHFLLCMCNALAVSEDHADAITLVKWHEHIFWMYLNFKGVRFAWKVRKHAALILRDLVILFGVDSIGEKLKKRHIEAKAIYDAMPMPKASDSLFFQTLEPLSFKAIQCAAALVCGDCQWLSREGPQTMNPRMFTVTVAEDTPVLPTDSSDSSADQH